MTQENSNDSLEKENYKGLQFYSIHIKTGGVAEFHVCTVRDLENALRTEALLRNESELENSRQESESTCNKALAETESVLERTSETSNDKDSVHNEAELGNASKVSDSSGSACNGGKLENATDRRADNNEEIVSGNTSPGVDSNDAQLKNTLPSNKSETLISDKPEFKKYSLISHDKGTILCVNENDSLECNKGELGRSVLQTSENETEEVLYINENEPFNWDETSKMNENDTLISLEEITDVLNTGGCEALVYEEVDLESPLLGFEGEPLIFSEIDNIALSEVESKELDMVEKSESPDPDNVETDRKPNSFSRPFSGRRTSVPFICAYLMRRFAGMLPLPWGVVLPKPVSNTKLLPCEYCEKSFRSKAVLQTHTRIHTGFMPFFCKYCGKHFRLSMSLRHHHVVCKRLNDNCEPLSHPLPKNYSNPYACETCGKKYKFKASLKDHMKIHIGEVRYKQRCKLCGAKFPKQGDLIEHRKTHENTVIYSCKTCGKEFLKEKHLNDHVVRHSELRPFHCSICNATYKRKSNLTRHLLTHTIAHKPIRVPLVNIEAAEEFRCEICGKVFKAKQHLKQHLVSHSSGRSHVCQICGARFAYVHHLNRHNREVHQRLKKYSCEVCHQSFSTKITMTNHLRIHTGERPFQCSTCGKTFRLRATLELHEKMHHSSDIRPYPCTYCMKSFVLNAHLVSHLRTHTGEKRPKRVSCPVCDKKYANKGDMKKHLKKHMQNRTTQVKHTG